MYCIGDNHKANKEKDKTEDDRRSSFVVEKPDPLPLHLRAIFFAQRDVVGTGGREASILHGHTATEHNDNPKCKPDKKIHTPTNHHNKIFGF